MSERRKLVLVDGSAYCIEPSRATAGGELSRGEPTGAKLGMLNMIQKLIKEEQPQLMAIVFDAPGKTFRDHLFEAYKAQRTPDAGRSAPAIAAAARLRATYMGLPLLRRSKASKRTTSSALSPASGRAGHGRADLDRRQRYVAARERAHHVDQHDDGLTALRPCWREEQNPTCSPNRSSDYLALVGDTSDNIPGVPKRRPEDRGEVAGLDYGTVDNLVANANAIAGKVGESLRASW